MTAPRIVLVTGASGGIGLAVARGLAARGHVVYAGTRSPGALAGHAGITPVRLDITSSQEIDDALARIQHEVGRLDGLVGNAGYGQYGSVEEVDDEAARRQFDVNVFGTMAMVRAAVPLMRQQRSGRIITISSVAGRMSTQFAGWYAASKFAVEALHDALRLEVKPFGVGVSLIEPAAVRSEFEGAALRELRTYAGQVADYQRASSAFGSAVQRSYARAAEPEPVVRAVARALESPRPAARYPVPRGSAGAYIWARRLLSDRAMDALLTSQLGPRRDEA